MKHYITVEFLPILECEAAPAKTQIPPSETQRPLLKTFWWRFCSNSMFNVSKTYFTGVNLVSLQKIIHRN